MSNYFPISSDSGLFHTSYAENVHSVVKISHRISFVNFTSNSSLLALGCNTGNIYLFNTVQGIFRYWSTILSNEFAIDLMQFSPSEAYLAYTNKKYQIFIYKINLQNESTVLIRQIDNTMNNELIQSIIWDEDSSKLYYGTNNGSIDVVIVPQFAKDYFQLPSECILRVQDQSITQIDIKRDWLLISTNEKCFLFNLLTKISNLIGSKQRCGQYGSCFWMVPVTNTYRVIAARPNYRIWIASFEGKVQETQQYKTWTNSPIYKVNTTEPKTDGTGQFTFLYSLKNGLLMAGDVNGPILIINIQLKTCLASIDCGKSIQKISNSSCGICVIHNERNVSLFNVKSIKYALREMLSNTSDSVKAIDLFLSLIESSRKSSADNSLQPSNSNDFEYSENKKENGEFNIGTDMGVKKESVVSNEEIETRIVSNNEIGFVVENESVISNDEIKLYVKKESFVSNSELDSSKSESDNIKELCTNNSYENDENGSCKLMMIKLEKSQREIVNKIDPELLTQLVERSAELQYRFSETNQLQVLIRDNEEYQQIFMAPKKIQTKAYKTSNGYNNNIVSDGVSSIENSIDSTDSFFTGSRTTSKPDKSRRKLKQNSSKPQLLKTLYDKTSTFLSNMDIISSSNSDLHLNIVESYPIAHNNNISYENVNIYSTTTITNDLSKGEEKYIVPPKINTMELEANIYIAGEKLKLLKNNNSEETRKEFEESLYNFCESWLVLTWQYWSSLRNYEVEIRTLSGTFPILYGDSINSNSWSNCIHVSEWYKPIVINEKIVELAQELLVECCQLQLFQQINEGQLMIDIDELTRSNRSKYRTYLESSVIDDGSGCKGVQLDSKQYEIDFGNDRFEKYKQLFDIIGWPIKLNYNEISWTSNVLVNFKSSLNLKFFRGWMVSGINIWIWTEILESFREIFHETLSYTILHRLNNKGPEELQKLMLGYLVQDNIESLVIIDEIFHMLHKLEPFPWKIVIESDNLECRNMLNLCFRHQLNVVDYMVCLFTYSSGSVRFNSRRQLLEHLYDKTDVLISFVFSTLVSYKCPDQAARICSCGNVLSFVKPKIPDVQRNILIELLRWGSNKEFCKTESNIFHILTTLCIEHGFHDGYLELLIGMEDYKKIISFGMSVNKYDIIMRIKDLKITDIAQIRNVIECLIETRRKLKVGFCINCGVQTTSQSDQSQQLFPWKFLGQFIFTELIVTNSVSYDANAYSLIKFTIDILKPDEIGYLTEYLSVVINNHLLKNGNKLGQTDQLYEFLVTESKETSYNTNTSYNPNGTHHQLTELYLDLYSKSRSQLCGNQWGRILTKSTLCDLCGSAFLLDDFENDFDNHKAEPQNESKSNHVRKPSRIRANSVIPNGANSKFLIAFSCGHCFHTKCLSNFTFEFCVLC